MDRLEEIYRRYRQTLAAAKQDAAPLAGVFGFAGGPKSHPCHDEFYTAVGQWVAELLAAQPSSSALLTAARFLLSQAASEQGQDVYWYFLAAQNHTKALIQQLNPVACEALRQEYDALYPATARLPLHKEIYDLLCQKADYHPPKKRLFPFLYG